MVFLLLKIIYYSHESSISCEKPYDVQNFNLNFRVFKKDLAKILKFEDNRKTRRDEHSSKG